MCGIAGIAGPYRTEERRVALRAMADAMRHRGPDDEGIWTGEGAGLSFRRLAIIDPADGRQPMGNEDGSVQVVFNGEIYNHAELRDELSQHGHVFVTDHSDTEVLVHGWEEWGADLLHRLNGMFAIGVWDVRRRELFLARDRLGIKPLYFVHRGDLVLFASEVKAFVAAGLLDPTVSPEALEAFLTFCWVPDPETMFREVTKLAPGHWLSFRNGRVELRRYWDIPVAPDLSTPREAWPTRLAEALDRSVRRRLISDVPLGAFLSGGLDSSAIVALASPARSDPMKVFSIAFREEDLLEDIRRGDAEYARLVAARFPTDYEELVLEPSVTDLLPKIVAHMDEPVADPGAVTTYLICREARRDLVVLLSGMGADEVLAGYPRHVGMRLSELYHVIPSPVRSGLLRPLARRLPGARVGRLQRVFRNFKKFAASADGPFEERYLGLLTYYHEDLRRRLLAPDLRVATAGFDPYFRHREHLGRVRSSDPLNRLLYLDQKTFLPSMNLTYTDKMSMAASVEVRVPFLDHELVELAGHMPVNLKLRGLTQKYALKKGMEGCLPHEVISRKKEGFGAPIGAWLRGPLKEMTRDLLAPASIRAQGLLDPDAVGQVLEDFYSGREYYAFQIWQLLTLQLWTETFVLRRAEAFVSRQRTA